MQCEIQSEGNFGKLEFKMLFQKKEKYSNEDTELESLWGALQKYGASVYIQNYFNKDSLSVASVIEYCKYSQKDYDVNCVQTHF